MAKYQHYKGGICTVLTTRAQHTETYERVVVYRNEEGGVFVRPYDMFFDKVEVDGVMVERFKEMKPFTNDEIIEGFSKIGARIMNEQLEKYGRGKL